MADGNITGVVIGIALGLVIGIILPLLYNSLRTRQQQQARADFAKGLRPRDSEMTFMVNITPPEGDDAKYEKYLTLLGNPFYVKANVGGDGKVLNFISWSNGDQFRPLKGQLYDAVYELHVKALTDRAVNWVGVVDNAYLT